MINITAKEVADWLSEDRTYSDVIVRSRMRLARNLQIYLLIDRASEREQQEIITEVLQAAEETTRLKQATYFDMYSVDEQEHQFFIERRLISLDFSEKSNSRGLMAAADESADIMINEEDYLRIQLFLGDFSLKRGWQEIHQLDEELSKKLNYSFLDQLGYLTVCPINVSTGVRLSVFIHLPALIDVREIAEVFSKMIPTGIAVCSFYGEGNQITGNFFQISKQYTLNEQMLISQPAHLQKKARRNLSETGIKRALLIQEKLNLN